MIKHMKLKASYIFIALLGTACFGEPDVQHPSTVTVGEPAEDKSGVCTQCALLVKNGQSTTHDIQSESAEGLYGPDDNLDGPAIENKYFSLFYPVMGGAINADIIGKKQYAPVLEKFLDDTKRHGNHSWGTDIFSTGGAMAAGTFSVGGIRPAWDNIDALEIDVLEDGPGDTKIRMTFVGFETGETKMNIVWTISTHWEARWVKNTLTVPPNLAQKIRFGMTKHLSADQYTRDAEAQLVYGLGDQTYPDVGGDLLLAIKGSKEQFEAFFEDQKNIGLILAPNNEGKVEVWTSISWEGEPSPLFMDSAWRDILFDDIESN